MVLLIIIPMKNGYFIGKINPTFSDIPIYFWATPQKNQIEVMDSPLMTLVTSMTIGDYRNLSRGFGLHSHAKLVHVAWHQPHSGDVTINDIVGTWNILEPGGWIKNLINVFITFIKKKHAAFMRLMLKNSHVFVRWVVDPDPGRLSWSWRGPQTASADPSHRCWSQVPCGARGHIDVFLNIASLSLELGLQCG